ncbi:MAG: DUF3859 domain-containing protein [Phycisphaerae bacterium]
MAKKNPDIRMVSFGRYTPFQKGSKEMPRILEFTTRIPGQIGTEFGYILKIRKARGMMLTFRIDHPPFLNEQGDLTPPFDGEMFVDANDYDFFLGDAVWAPAEDKQGDWTLTTWLDGEQIAEKRFTIVDPAEI